MKLYNAYVKAKYGADPEERFRVVFSEVGFVVFIQPAGGLLVLSRYGEGALTIQEVQDALKGRVTLKEGHLYRIRIELRELQSTSSSEALARRAFAVQADEVIVPRWSLSQPKEITGSSPTELAVDYMTPESKPPDGRFGMLEID